MKEIKILALSQENSGSKYHRIDMVVEQLNEKIVKLSEEEEGVLKFELQKVPKGELADLSGDFDILFFGWGVNNKVTELADLQSKGKKIIYDIDDYWEFSIENPHYKDYIKRGRAANMVKRFLLNSDVVITSTLELAKKCSNYNPNVMTIPNFIPLEGQFSREEGEYNIPLKVCLYGSVSHIPDWKLLKGAINRIAKNKKLAENCEFYLCGYAEGGVWEEILSMFKKKKNLKVFTKSPLPVKEYMSLLDGMNVCLMPLEDIEFNYTKSSLKQLECAIKGVIPLGSRIYTIKEMQGVLIADSPLEYESQLKKLLDKEYFDSSLKTITEHNLNNNKWEERFDFLKNVFGVTAKTTFEPVLEDVKLYGITYNEGQSTEYIQYDNSNIKTIEQKSYLFEYNVLLDLVKDFKDDEYYGVFSYKFPQKTGITKNILYKLLVMNKYKEYDVIGLSLNLFKGDYLKVSEEKHKGFTELFRLICKDLNLVMKEPTNVIYSNQFLAKGSVYKQFLNEVVNPAIELLETKYKDLAWKDANYIWGLKGEQLKEQTGLNYYPMTVFILERLLSVWLENKNMFSSNPMRNVKFMQLI